jgi:cell wall-associated NlpC family hydrolase
MEWASSFLNTPYAWGGQTRGGFQSRSPSDFTCSADLNPNTPKRESHKTDRVSKIGSSLYLYGGYGYGIDCSGFVGETCYIATNGRVPPDDLGTSVLKIWDKTSNSPRESVFVGSILIAKRVAYHNANAPQHHYVGVSYIRPGDFIAFRDHVVYAVSKWNHSARQIRVIEAYPGRKEVGGKVLVQTRSAESLGPRWVARRWVVR